MTNNLIQSKEPALGQKQRGKKYYARLISRKILNYLGLIIVSCFFLFPFFFMFFKAMMGNQESIGVPVVHFFPEKLQLTYFKKALDADMFLWLKNTVIVVVCNCIFVPLMSSLCAYGFSRLKFKTRDFWFYATLATMMLPGSVTQVPLYSLFHSLSLLGSIRALIIPNIFGGGAMNIFLIRQFMRSIPSALDEAATIDGASRLRIFWSIIFPSCTPIIIYVMINQFLGSWNDFSSPLIFANAEESYTLALGIYMRYMSTIENPFSNVKMAAGVLMCIPPVIVFLFMQKQLINGVITTGLKG